MAKSIDARLATLEAPQVDPARAYRMLKSCYAVLSRMDDVPMPEDAELWAMARQDIRPDYTAVMEAVWEGHDEQP